MASRQARQERQLERQRGAGRQVKNANVELILPTEAGGSLHNVRSGGVRKPSRSASLRPQNSSRRTPVVEKSRRTASSKTPQLQKDVQDSGQTPATQVAGSKRPRGRPSLTASRKKPRLSSAPTRSAINDGDEEVMAGVSSPGPPAESMSVKKRKKRKSIGQQSRRSSKPKLLQQPDLSSSKPAEKRGRPKSIGHALPVSNLDDEIQEQLRQETSDMENLGELGSQIILPSVEPTKGTGHTPYKKRKKRVSIGQQPRKKPRSQLAEVKEEPSEHSELALRDIPGQQENDEDESDVVDEEDEASEQDAELQRSRPISDDDTEEDADLEDNVLPDGSGSAKAKPKRKKRKSIGQQKSKRVSTTGAGTVKAGLRLGKRKDNQEQREAKRATIRRDQRRQSVPIRSASPVRAASTRPSVKKPAKAGRPKARSQPPIATLKQRSKIKAAPKIPVNAIPITVHRDPTPSDDDANDEDAITDPLRLVHTNKPKTFNAVDVLAQVTLERLSTFARKLNDQAPTSRTQRKALELYTEEVEVRLRRLSRALDRNKGLGLMAKRLGKEEKTLKSQVKEIEGRRKELERQKQEVEEKQKRFELGELLARIGEIARKGWELERSGTASV